MVAHYRPPEPTTGTHFAILFHASASEEKISVSEWSSPLAFQWSVGEDAAMERIEGLGPKRAPRVHRRVAEKRRIVELSLQPGMSVARAAQTAGVNANQVFKWRQDYRSGLLLEAGETATSLIPVVVAPASSEGDVGIGAPTSPVLATPAGAIHIDLPGRASISVEHGADAALLRMILESLRR